MHDETACGTDTNCEWDTNENKCTPTEEFEMPSAMNASAALEPRIEICSAFEQDECTGSCAYDMLMLPGGE